MSIKTKVITSLMVAILLTGSAVSGVGLFILYHRALSEAQMNMSTQAAQLAGEVSELFGAFTKSGDFFGKDDDLKSGDATRVQAKLNTYFATTWGADRLVFISPQGTRFATAPFDPKSIGGSVADRAFYKNTMQDQQSHISEVLINRASGIPSVIVTSPVKAADGKMAGFVAQSISLETLQRFLTHLKIGSTGTAAIIDQDGSLVAHTNKELVKEDNKQKETVMAAIKNNSGHLFSYSDLSGRETLALSLPVPNTPWFVVLSLPLQEFKSGFYQSLTAMAITLIVVLLVIGLISWIFMVKTLRPLEHVAREVVKIGDGDLTVRIESNSRDEIGLLTRALSATIGNFQQTIKKVQESCEILSASSEELTANTDQLSQTAMQTTHAVAEVADGTILQAQAVDDTMTSVEQMSAGIQQIAANSSHVSATAEKTSNAAREGGKAVEIVTNQMTAIEKSVANSTQLVAKLGERSQEIGQIIDTISGIAGQTNLLALNAAIEAARAGEQGRGFAVVAEEVRHLAEQSQQAAKEIGTLIGEIRNDTDKAVLSMDEGTSEVRKGSEVAQAAGQSFTEIAELIEQVSDQIRDISAAIEQMTSGSQQIADLVSGISGISKSTAGRTQSISAATQEQSASIESIAAASVDLSKMAGNLQSLVTMFKI
ncbi:MAG TPA: methyl-accepting chemotaxis protein [Patescibacteria group bacterium]|nr:methyl-accepting chemotaxis protein [Patescibacteria group bacterium]